MSMLDSFLSVIRFGSASSFLGVVGCFVFLLLIPRNRLTAYLSQGFVRRFVEYFGNVGLGDEASASHEAERNHRSKIAGRA
jgi:hypothetical protein